MKISKLRRKLKDKKFLNNQYDRLTLDAEKWHKFNEWECSIFFVGSERSERNKEIYNKAIFKIRRQINFIKKLLQP